MLQGILAAIHHLQQRCLYHSTNFAAKLLPFPAASSFQTAALLKLNEAEISLLTLIKTYIDLREHAKVQDVLQHAPPPRKCSALLNFLRFYARFMEVEKDHFQFQVGSSNQQLSKTLLEKHHADLNSLLSDIQLAGHEHDAFLLYLYLPLFMPVRSSFSSGVINARLKHDRKAIELLVESLVLFPLNWSAFKELLCLNLSVDCLATIKHKLCTSPCFNFFMAQYAIDHSHPEAEIVKHLEALQKLYPEHPDLPLYFGLYHYNNREFDMASQWFRGYYERNPSSMESIDIYSNILFLSGDAIQLSLLAQKCQAIDRFRPETSLVIANYYALKGQHEKAVSYFKQTLKLNRNYLAAWTLLGHEYLELHNYRAALESYRTAVDIDQNDYRAWFGLGQVYEILGLLPFAIYNYQKASLIRSEDKRIWSALGDVYVKWGNSSEGICCYIRSLGEYLPPHMKQRQLPSKGKAGDTDQSGEADSDGELFQAAVGTWFKIGALYAIDPHLSRVANALKWYLDGLELGDVTKQPEWATAALFVANHYRKQSGSVAKAETYLRTVVKHYPHGAEKEEAKMMLAVLDGNKGATGSGFQLHRR